jgi:hypothetical protein
MPTFFFPLARWSKIAGNNLIVFFKRYAIGNTEKPDEERR